LVLGKIGGTELNGTHQLLVYADDVTLLGNNLNTRKKNTHTLISDSKEVGLEVNTEESEYMLLSRHQNAGQIHDIKIANRSFENVAQFKYFWNKNNKSKFDSGEN
jgi:hypothetical protein